MMKSADRYKKFYICISTKQAMCQDGNKKNVDFFKQLSDNIYVDENTTC